MSERFCATCGKPIKPQPGSPLGWTHTGSWQGKRCAGRITGAAPVEAHQDKIAAWLDELTPEARQQIATWIALRYGLAVSQAGQEGR